MDTCEETSPLLLRSFSANTARKNSGTTMSSQEYLYGHQLRRCEQWLP